MVISPMSMNSAVSLIENPSMFVKIKDVSLQTDIVKDMEKGFLIIFSCAGGNSLRGLK